MLLLLSFSLVITLAVLAAAVTCVALDYSDSCTGLFYATAGTFQRAELASGWFIFTVSANFLSTVN